MYIIIGSSKLVNDAQGLNRNNIIIKTYDDIGSALDFVTSPQTNIFDWLHIYDSISQKTIWTKKEILDEDKIEVI